MDGRMDGGGIEVNSFLVPCLCVSVSVTVHAEACAVKEHI